MESLEISNHSLDDLLPPSNLYQNQNDSSNRRDEDLDELLDLPVVTLVPRPKTRVPKSPSKCCYDHYNKCRNAFTFRFHRIGNFRILNSTIYQKSQAKWCIIGPHWYGFLITASLLSGASVHYIHKAWTDVGPVSTVICILLTAIAFMNLFSVGLSDPGIVRKVRVSIPSQEGKTDHRHAENENIIVTGSDGKGEYQGLLTEGGGGRKGGDNSGEEEEHEEDHGWRYCAFCDLYQPPNAAHCPECNACIDGYHHHCFWMGKCIGKKNLKHFHLFNLTWMVYVLYASIWISWIGPRI